jgi:hypothetical protein
VPGDGGSAEAQPPSKVDAEAPPADASAPDAAKDEAGSDAGVDDAGDNGHVIDGVNDFKPGETFSTSSAASGYTAYVSWDAVAIYFGMSGQDIGQPASDKKWLLLYLGTGTGGTTTGIDYNDGGSAASQQPTLPFSALYHVRLKTDLSYVNGQTWSGSAWVAASGLVPDCERKAQFVECRVARSALGNPATLKFHASMVKEQPSAEWTYAAVPQSSFVDGPDPNYTKYFEFDLGDLAKAPNTYAAK